jgi:hypothetical protein
MAGAGQGSQLWFVDVVGEVEGDAFGFMPNAAGTILGSMVLTRLARRVQRRARGGTPQPSKTWLA